MPKIPHINVNDILINNGISESIIQTSVEIAMIEIVATNRTNIK